MQVSETQLQILFYVISQVVKNREIQKTGEKPPRFEPVDKESLESVKRRRSEEIK